MIKTMHGKAHGRIIELDEDLGVADGQEIQVQVIFPRPKKQLPGPPPGWQAGNTKSTAGSLADLWTETEDRMLQEIHDARRLESRREMLP